MEARTSLLKGSHPQTHVDSGIFRTKTAKRNQPYVNDSMRDTMHPRARDLLVNKEVVLCSSRGWNAQ